MKASNVSFLRVHRENHSVSVGHGLMVPTKTGHVSTVEQPCTSRMQHEGSQGRQHKHNEASEGIAVRLTGVCRRRLHPTVRLVLIHQIEGSFRFSFLDSKLKIQS